MAASLLSEKKNVLRMIFINFFYALGRGEFFFKELGFVGLVSSGIRV